MGAFSDRMKGGGGSLLSTLRQAAPEPQQGLGDPDYSIGRAGTQSQFPEAAAYSRLQGNVDQAQKVAAAFDKLGMARPEEVTRVLEGEGYVPEEPGAFESVVGAVAGNPIGRGALRFLNVLGGGARVIQTALKEMTDSKAQLADVTGRDYWDIFWGDPEKQQEILMRTGIDTLSGSQLLSMWGWGEQESFGGKAARFGAHALLEIVTDPLSYLSLGAGGVARKALGETGDVAVQRVVREVVQDGLTDNAAQKMVRNRLDDVGETMYNKIIAGDEAAIKEVFGGMDKEVVDELRKAADVDYAAAEMLADQADNFARNRVTKELQDELVGPLLKRDFGAVDYTMWGEYLPKYAWGGVRMVANPFAFGSKKFLEKGAVIGGQGSGKALWEATGKKILDNISSSRMPLANSKTVGDVFSSLRKSADLDYTLLRAVRTGELTGGEYMMLKDAMEHSVTNYHLTEISARAGFETQDTFKKFKGWADSEDWADEAATSAMTGSNVEALQHQAREFEAGLHNFITKDSDELFFAGRKVAEDSDFYRHAVEIRGWARDVMGEYNRKIKELLPEYTNGIENYLPFHIQPEMREFLARLVDRAPSVANIAKVGPEGGADFYVGTLLNTIVSGGPTEAAMGSTAYLNARVFTDSPMVQIVADQPLVMMEKQLLENIASLLENVEPAHIGVVQFNELVSGKLKELAKEYNVPLPKKFSGGEATLQVFTEDPFDLVNAYAHSMENALRQRKAALTMEQFGRVQTVSHDIAVQRTIQEIRNRITNPKFLSAVERVDKMVSEYQEFMPKFYKAAKSGDIRKAATEVRYNLGHQWGTEDGWHIRLYDRPLDKDEVIIKYLGIDQEQGIYRGYHGWTGKHTQPGPNLEARALETVQDPYGPVRNLEDMVRAQNEPPVKYTMPYWSYREEPWFKGLQEFDDGQWRLDVDLSSVFKGGKKEFWEVSSEEEALDIIAKLQEKINPNRVEQAKQLRGVAERTGGKDPRPIWAGATQLPGIHTQSRWKDMRSGKGRISEFTVTDPSFVAPKVITDELANAIDQFHLEFTRARKAQLASEGSSNLTKRAFFRQRYLKEAGFYEKPTGLWSHEGFKDWEEAYNFTTNYEIFPHVNPIEDQGHLSYMFVGPRGAEWRDVRYHIDANDNLVMPVAAYDAKTNRFIEWSRVADPDSDEAVKLFSEGDVHEVSYVLRPNTQSRGSWDGPWDSHPVVTMRLKDRQYSADEKYLMQVELSRFMRARNESSYAIVHTRDGMMDWAEPEITGTLDDIIELTDQDVLAEQLAGLQRIEKGLDPGENMAERAVIVGSVAKEHRKRMIHAGRAIDSMSAEGTERAERMFGHWRANEPKRAQVYYNDQGEVFFVEEGWNAPTTGTSLNQAGEIKIVPNTPGGAGSYSGQFSGGAIIFNENASLLSRLSGRSISETGELIAEEGKIANKHMAKIYREIEAMQVQLGKEQNLAKAVVSKGAQGPGFGISTQDALDLRKIMDLSAIEDDAVFAMALQDIREAVSSGTPQNQKWWLKWATERYGKEAVALATKQPEELLQMHLRNFEFVEAIQKLLKLGRDQDGDILQSTAFTATKDGDLADLLKHSRKLAKDFGVDPDTFEPVYSVNALHKYEWVDPVTGLTHERNLVNPQIFGVGGPALEGKVVDREIAEWFGAVAQNAASIYTPVGFAAMKTGFSEATRWWKAMATVTRPTFHIRNAMGAFWNNQIVGVQLRDYAAVSTNARRLRKAMDKGLELGEAIQSLPDKKMRSVFQAAFDHGVMDNSFAMSEIMSQRTLIGATKIKSAMKHANPLSLDGFGVKVGGNVMETIEDFFRMSAFHAWYDPNNPATAKVAREMVYATQFNYAYLTKYETKIKEIIPFFVWMRRNIPLQLQVMAERPGLMTRYAHLMEAFDDNFGSQEGQGADLPGSPYLTAFAADSGIVLNEGTPYWARIMLDPQIPPVDLFEHFDSMNPLEILANFSEGIHPAAQLVFSRDEQKDYRNVNTPAPMSAIVEELAKLGFWDVSQDGDVQIPYFLRTLISATAPFANEWNDIASSISPAFQQEPTRLADIGIATEEDPDNPLVNALTSLGLTLGRGVGLQAKTPRDTAGQAYRVQDMLSKLTNEQFRNTPGFQEAYENS